MNLNQVTLASSNIEKSVKFYQMLGLKLIVDASPNYVRFECPDGDSTFSLHFSGDINVQGTTIYFEHEELEEMVKTLKEKGIKFDSDPELKPWMWYEAHLRDPDGHHIILFRAGENRKNPPWRIA